MQMNQQPQQQQEPHQDDDDPPVMSQAMLKACYDGDTNEITRLLDAGEDVNLADANGMTPLLAAMVAGHTEAAKSLLERGADVLRTDTNGCNVLHYAAVRGNRGSKVFILKWVLINTTIDVNSTDNVGNTPINIALASDHLNASLLLVEKGANLFIKNNRGEQAINNGDENLGPQVLQHAKDLIWQSVKPFLLLIKPFSASTVLSFDSNNSVPPSLIKVFNNSDITRHIASFFRVAGIIASDPTESDEVKKRVEAGLLSDRNKRARM
jgi:ankyrin repeat protein